MYAAFIYCETKHSNTTFLCSMPCYIELNAKIRLLEAALKEMYRKAVSITCTKPLGCGSAVPWICTREWQVYPAACSLLLAVQLDFSPGGSPGILHGVVVPASMSTWQLRSKDRGTSLVHSDGSIRFFLIPTTSWTRSNSRKMDGVQEQIRQGLLAEMLALHSPE